MSYEGIIFDFDGVLLNSAFNNWEWAAKARKAKARELGYKYEGDGTGFLFQTDSLDEMKQMAEQNGMEWDDYIKIEKAAARRKAEMVKEGQMKLFPETFATLEKIDKSKAIVSNAFGETVDKIVNELGLDQHFQYWTAPRLEEIERYHELMKPETHMLEEAIERIGTRNVIMAGDSNFDLKAAKNAGIDSIFVDRGKEVSTPYDYRVKYLKEIPEKVFSQR